MKIISWNVLKYVNNINGDFGKSYINVGQVDIVMLQEHHLNERRTKVYGSLLPGN